MMTHAPGDPIVIANSSWWHVRQIWAYHRRYPEVRGEGRSRGAELAHLANQLIRVLDSAPGHGHRDAIERAIAEVRARRQEVGRRRPPRHRDHVTIPGWSNGHRIQTE